MYSFEAITGEGAEQQRVLVVQASKGQTVGDVLEEVRRKEARTKSLAVRPLVIRLPVELSINPGTFDGEPGSRGDLIDALLQSWPPALARAQDRSVHILTAYRGAAYVTRGLNAVDVPDDLSLIDRKALLDDIRQSEFRHLVERSKALLSAPPGTVFRAPSRLHVKNFVRVGNVQSDRDALDGIAFWCLPHLRDRDAIVVDTWSISSTALNSARVAAVHFEMAAPRVEILPGYNDGSNDARTETITILQRVAADVGRTDDKPTRLLIMISATQSGSLAEIVRKLCVDAKCKLDTTFLALFALLESNLPRLSDFVGDDKRFAFERETKSPTVVDIDPQVYFPLDYTDVEYRLRKPDAQRHRQFFDAYRETKVIRVHADGIRKEAQAQHHAFRVDLDEILGTERFRQRLSAALEGMGPQRAILAPPHSPAQRLAVAIQDMLAERGPMPAVLPVPVPGGAVAGSDDAEAAIRDAESDDEILIVEDVCIGTARIAQIDKQLRTADFAGRANYVIGVHTDEDPAEWTAFCSRIVARGDLPQHTVHAIEELPLPDFGRDECPWCQELDLYDAWAQVCDLPATLVARRRLLTDAGVDGLTDDVYLHPAHLPRPTLGPRSFYVAEGCSQAHVTGAAAAAIQHLRAYGHGGKPNLGPRHFPIATVLDHRDYLDQKWTDTVLRAAFLRAATMDELVWTTRKTEERRTVALQKLIDHASAAEHDLVLEILIAAHLDKATLTVADAELAARIGSLTPDGTARYVLDRLQDLEKLRNRGAV